jgi:hypothetical protein
MPQFELFHADYLLVKLANTAYHIHLHVPVMADSMPAAAGVASDSSRGVNSSRLAHAPAWTGMSVVRLRLLPAP